VNLIGEKKSWAQQLSYLKKGRIYPREKTGNFVSILTGGVEWFAGNSVERFQQTRRAVKVFDKKGKVYLTSPG